MMNERIDVIAEDLREMGLSKSFTDDIDLVWKIHKNASPSQFEQKMSEEKASEETISKWLAYEYGPPYTKMYIMLPDKIPEITGFEIPDRIKQKLKPNILYCVEYDGLKKQWYIDGSKI